MDVTDAGAGIAPEAAGAPESGQVPTPSERRKIKIDGNEEEVDVDAVLKDYQKYRASDKRFQEAAAIRKEAEAKESLVQSLLQKAQSGDLSWLKGLVPEDTLRGWAESELLEHINWQNTPEVERRAIMAERRAKELEEKVNGYTQTKEREEASKLEEEAYRTIEDDIVSAVKGVGFDVKVTPRYIRRIAEQMRASLEASDDPSKGPMKASDAASRAFKGLKVDTQELLSILPTADILALLPPHVRKAIRQQDVEDAISQAPGMRRSREPQGVAPSQKTKLWHGSSDDAFKKIEKRYS